MSTGETGLALAKDEETKVRVGMTWEVIFMANSWEFYGDFMDFYGGFMVILEALLHLSADFYGNPWHHSSGQTLIFLHMDLRGRFEASMDN
jgi:hypothetical protein